MEADSSVAEDPVVEAMVDVALSSSARPFVAGPDFQCHTFGVNAFPFGKGHTLCDPMDTVVGHTDVTIQRWNVLEDVSNNVMVDAFLDLAKNLGEMDSKGMPLTDANTLSTTNGFRFDIVISGTDEVLSDGLSPAATSPSATCMTTTRSAPRRAWPSTPAGASSCTGRGSSTMCSIRIPIVSAAAGSSASPTTCTSTSVSAMTSRSASATARRITPT